MTPIPKTSIVTLDCSFEPIHFRAPLKFGGRVVDHSYCINVRVRMKTQNGREVDGFGSMPVGNVWAWPTSKLTGDETEAAMKRFAELLTESPDFQGNHPVEIMHNLMTSYPQLAATVAAELNHAEAMPQLAQLVAASALDAAVHDAFGRVHSISSYRALGREYLDRPIADFLGDEQFRGDYLDAFVLDAPTKTLPLYHLVGALDPLTDEDINGDRLNDDLPETLPEWIRADGLTHMKIKLNGDDIDWDVNRVLRIDEVSTPVQAERGCGTWFYSCDFNEKCENVEYVLEFLHRIREQSSQAFDRIQYIEQPTSRDLKANPDNRMHEAAKIKPVVIDEALTDYESLLLARDLGYSGVALKACKGHTESLLLAAAAQKFGMFLCVQDLTCPGYSFLHSASLAAWIPGIAAIEGNARQFCPSANDRWVSKFPSMFDITDGSVATGVLDGAGLGFEYVTS